VAGHGEAAGVSARRRATAKSATDREIAVVVAVVAAGSEKAAAHELGLSHSTVKHHLANARSKVGATTTAQLVWMLAPQLPEPAALTWPRRPPDSERATRRNRQANSTAAGSAAERSSARSRA
jgi:DNA-binding CsgD family transcriptional regulator